MCKTSNVSDPAGCTGSSCYTGKYCAGNALHQDKTCDASGGCATDGPVVQSCQGANSCCDHGCSNGACTSAFKGTLECNIACAYYILFCLCW